MNSINQSEYSRFEQYYENKLGAKEKRAIEEELNQNTGLKISYDRFLQDRLLIKELAKDDLRIQAAELLRKNSEQENDTKKKRNVFTLPIFRIAASLAILITASVIWYNQAGPQSTDDLFAEYFEPLQPSFSRSDASEEEQFRLAMEAYSNGDLDQAIRKLREIESTGLEGQNVNMDRIQLYLGISYLGVNDPITAIKKLGQVSPESSYYTDAIWYQCLALIKSRETESAKEILEELISINHYKSKAALKILAKLE